MVDVTSCDELSEEHSGYVGRHGAEVWGQDKQSRGPHSAACIVGNERCRYCEETVCSVSVSLSSSSSRNSWSIVVICGITCWNGCPGCVFPTSSATIGEKRRRCSETAVNAVWLYVDLAVGHVCCPSSVQSEPTLADGQDDHGRFCHRRTECGS